MGQLSGAQTYLRNKIYAARHAIYQLGKPIKGTAVESILKDWSLVPTLVRQILYIHPYLVLKRSEQEHIC